MKETEINILFGTAEPKICPMQPFAEKIISFLDAWSRGIRQDVQAKSYPDIVTFAFWIRKANVVRLKEKSGTSALCRIGRGLAFHIAPSNVAINFAYSFVFGLLAGNANIVRVSSKDFPQNEVVCRILKEVVLQEEFQWVGEQNGIVQYSRENGESNQKFSEMCNSRIIWGGDKTIQELRKYPLMPRGNEITFADRYSFAMLSADAVLALSAEERTKLAEGFYNDTYLMDQNACSSPHLICWLGGEGAVKEAKAMFWEEVYGVSQKYDLADVKASEKYTLACIYAAKSIIADIRKYENYLYIAELKGLPDDITGLRGKYGLFFEYAMQDISDVLQKATGKVQTCAVFGIEEREVLNALIEYHVQGVDRIVEIGHTLDMDVFWDGYDVIGVLSRNISCGR